MQEVGNIFRGMKSASNGAIPMGSNDYDKLLDLMDTYLDERYSATSYAYMNQKTFNSLQSAWLQGLFYNLPRSMRHKYFASKSKLKVKRG